MHEDLRNVTHSYALHALRQTPNRVKLVKIKINKRIFFIINTIDYKGINQAKNLKLSHHVLEDLKS